MSTARPWRCRRGRHRWSCWVQVRQQYEVTLYVGLPGNAEKALTNGPFPVIERCCLGCGDQERKVVRT